MKIAVLLMIVAAGLLIGCASVGRPVDPGRLAQIERGKSTLRDVVALMGEPQSVSEVDGPGGKRTELHYVYSHVSADGKNFIPFYGDFAQEYHTKSQHVVVTLDRNGVVESVSKNFGGITSKSGTATEQPKTSTALSATEPALRVERSPQGKAPNPAPQQRDPKPRPLAVSAVPYARNAMVATRRPASMVWIFPADSDTPLLFWVAPRLP